MTEVTVVCCAKVNLTLDVLDLRPDGYHNIESVMQSIDLSDTLHVRTTPGSGIVVESDSPEAPSGPGNTVYTACELFKEAAGVDVRIAVSIEKKVPVQAGLGGGSSDAAGALSALNSIFGSPLSGVALADIAVKVGSDVPFFLTGGTALVKGRGEIVEKLPDAPQMDIVIVKPDFGVSTAWAYSRLSERLLRQGGTAGKMVDAIRRGDRKGIIIGLANDFEHVVADEYLLVAESKRRMADLGADGTLLSGSGAAVFGVFPDAQRAQRACTALESAYDFVAVTRTTSTAITIRGGTDES